MNIINNNINIHIIVMLIVHYNTDSVSLKFNS